MIILNNSQCSTLNIEFFFPLYSNFMNNLFVLKVSHYVFLYLCVARKKTVIKWIWCLFCTQPLNQTSHQLFTNHKANCRNTVCPIASTNDNTVWKLKTLEKKRKETKRKLYNLNKCFVINYDVIFPKMFFSLCLLLIDQVKKKCF